MPAPYSKDFKQAAIKKILNRGDRTVAAACEEVGISQAAFNGWIRNSGITVGMNQSSRSSKASNGKRAQDYTASEKLEAVLEFKKRAGEPGAQGEYLRSHGLHTATLEAWEKEILGALAKPARQRRTPEEIAKDRKISELERELRRKDKALAETTALLVLKKKAESIWGLVDDEESA